MDAELIKRLVPLVAGDDKERLLIAVNWVQQARERAKGRPSAAATADLVKAKAHLDEVATPLVALHLPAEAPTPPPAERFKNRAEAWRWMLANGATISERKFRADAESGAYIVYPDRSVSRASVAEYLVRIKGDAPVVDLDLVDYSQQRQRLELRRLELEVERLEMRNRSEDKQWMLVDDHYAQLLAALNVLRGHLEHCARIEASQIVLEAGGDYHQGPLVADKVVELVINKAFNDLADMRIDAGRFETVPTEQETENE